MVHMCDSLSIAVDMCCVFVKTRNAVKCMHPERPGPAKKKIRTIRHGSETTSRPAPTSTKRAHISNLAAHFGCRHRRRRLSACVIYILNFNYRRWFHIPCDTLTFWLAKWEFTTLNVHSPTHLASKQFSLFLNLFFKNNCLHNAHICSMQICWFSGVVKFICKNQKSIDCILGERMRSQSTSSVSMLNPRHPAIVHEH